MKGQSEPGCTENVHMYNRIPSFSIVGGKANLLGGKGVLLGGKEVLLGGAGLDEGSKRARFH